MGKSQHKWWVLNGGDLSPTSYWLTCGWNEHNATEGGIWSIMFVGSPETHIEKFKCFVQVFDITNFDCCEDCLEQVRNAL